MHPLRKWHKWGPLHRWGKWFDEKKDWWNTGQVRICSGCNKKERHN